MKKDHLGHDSNKKKYEAPKLTSFVLRADEVLAVGCKTGGGVAAAALSPPCWSNNCSSEGS